MSLSALTAQLAVIQSDTIPLTHSERHEFGKLADACIVEMRLDAANLARLAQLSPDIPTKDARILCAAHSAWIMRGELPDN